MSTIQRSRTAVPALIAVLMFALSAPVPVIAQDEDLALAPAGPTWDETSGYGSVEASRATVALPASSTTAEANRVAAARRALLSSDLGSMQEEALSALVEAATTWDETSGYGALEASRAGR